MRAPWSHFQNHYRHILMVIHIIFIDERNPIYGAHITKMNALAPTQLNKRELITK